MSRKLVKCLAFTVLVLMISLSAQAQHTHNTYDGLTYGGGGVGGDNPGDGFGVDLTGGYDLPMGDLGKVFKPAPTYGFGILYNTNGLSLSVNIGAVSYKPKLDTIYYYAPKQTIGSLAWNDDKVTQLYFGAAYNIPIDDGVKFFVGLNVGDFMDKISYHTVDIYENTEFDKTEQELYLAPKAGVSFDIDENVSINPNLRFDYFKPLSGTDDNPYILKSNEAVVISMTVSYVF